MTLDGPRVIGNLSFDDQNITRHKWILEPGNAGQLTLAGAAPSILVLTCPAFLSVPLAGTAGLTKSGAGKLTARGQPFLLGPNHR